MKKNYLMVEIRFNKYKPVKFPNPSGTMTRTHYVLKLPQVEAEENLTLPFTCVIAILQASGIFFLGPNCQFERAVATSAA